MPPVGGSEGPFRVMSVQAVLRILNGPHKSERLVFEESRDYLIGRKRDCDLPVTDGYMSRVHFRIAADGSAFIVEDLGSSHGTLLNGRKLSGKTVLQDGDLIRAGQTDFVFQSGTEVRALGTAPKTVMGSPQTMLERILPGGDSRLLPDDALPSKEPETAAAPLSPAQLASMGIEAESDRAHHSETGPDFDPEMTSDSALADNSAVASEPEIPSSEAKEPSDAAQAEIDVSASSQVKDLPASTPPAAANELAEQPKEDEWESAWQSPPTPDDVRPSAPPPVEADSGEKKKAEGDDLDWWTE